MITAGISVQGAGDSVRRTTPYRCLYPVPCTLTPAR